MASRATAAVVLRRYLGLGTCGHMTGDGFGWSWAGEKSSRVGSRTGTVVNDR